MTGEMKIAKTLCRKGFPPSDGRDEGIYALRLKILALASVPAGRAEDSSQDLREAPEHPLDLWSLAKARKGAQEESFALHSQRGSVRLSGWEQNIPTLGTPLLILLNGSSEGLKRTLFYNIARRIKTCLYDSPLERKSKKVVFLFCSLLTYSYLCTIA